MFLFMIKSKKRHTPYRFMSNIQLMCSQWKINNVRELQLVLVPNNHRHSVRRDRREHFLLVKTTTPGISRFALS